MASTFSQIYIQIVFAVKGRQNRIGKEWKDELFKYISGIITNKGQKSIIVNGVADHVHIFVGSFVQQYKNFDKTFVYLSVMGHLRTTRKK